MGLGRSDCARGVRTEPASWPAVRRRDIRRTAEMARCNCTFPRDVGLSGAKVTCVSGNRRRAHVARRTRVGGVGQLDGGVVRDDGNALVGCLAQDAAPLARRPVHAHVRGIVVRTVRR